MSLAVSCLADGIKEQLGFPVYPLAQEWERDTPSSRQSDHMAGERNLVDVAASYSCLSVFPASCLTLSRVGLLLLFSH